MLRRTRVLTCLLLLPVAAQAQDYDRSLAEESPAAVPSDLLPPPQGLIDLLANGSFEANGGAGTHLLDDWTVVNLPGSVNGTPGSGDWYAQTGSESPENAFPVDPSTDGSFAAMTDSTGPGGHVLYQDFTVPGGGGELACDIYVNNAGSDFFDAGSLDYETVPNQQARVDLMDPAAPDDDVGAGVLGNLFITNPGDPPVQAYQTIGTSLDPYAGQTIRLRFAEVDNQLFLNVGIDRCVAVGEELSTVEIPTLGMAGILALVLLLVGVGVFALRRRSAA